MIFSSFVIKNSDPNSAFDSDAATNLSIWHSVNIAPLMWMGGLSCGVHPRKQFLSIRLCTSLADKYDASEWTFRIMLDA